MLSIQNYALPETLDEAYELLNSKKSNTILGGSAFLRLSSQKIGTAIDLARLNLDFIKESSEAIEIGAMATFRMIETSSLLGQYFNGILAKSVSHIVGVQLRNIVTVGATVYSRYGFSDFLTALLCLDTEVVLYKAGQMTLAKFLEEGSPKDILVKIIIPKTQKKAAFAMMRNSHSDYALLNVAVSKDNDSWKLVIGARPQRAKIATKATHFLSQSKMTEKEIEETVHIAADELTFGSNMRASKEYREALCKVLLKRAIMEVLE